MFKDDDYEIVLIKEYNGRPCGDILKVGKGLYYSLIKLKIGISINDNEGVEENMRLAISCKNYVEEIKRLEERWGNEMDNNWELKEKIAELKEKLDAEKEKIKKEKKKFTNYKNKMVKTENIKTK